MKKSIKLILGIFIFVFVMVPFINVNAAEAPTIVLTPKGDFYVGESQTFDITTTKPAGYGDVKVIGVGSISEPDALEKLEYFEENNSQWYDLNKQFGISTGFPLGNVTATFRATFNKAGTYVAKFEIQDAQSKAVIASGTMNIEVKDKTVANVKNEAELRAALNNADVTTINLLNDITTAAKINIMKDVTINGNGHKIALTNIDKNVWGGHYVLQAYNAQVTLKNITLSGGNAGLLINGAKVKLEGTVNVSDNGFGGIELSKGADLTVNPTIDTSNVTIVNTTEAYTKPTMWIDPKLNVTVNYAGFESVVETEGQMHYYLNKSNSHAKADDQITSNPDDKVIDVVTTPDDSISKDVLNDLKNGEEKVVNIKVGNVTISFNTKNITTDFTNDLKLNVNVTEEQPFESEVLKGVDSKLLFIDLAYSGPLATGTKISFLANGTYQAGDKVYLYYYNPETNKVELISKDVVIDENGYATVAVDHASTYFLSDKEIADTTTNTNPNTSDMTIMIVAILAVAGVCGLAFVAKNKLALNK